MSKSVHYLRESIGIPNGSKKMGKKVRRRRNMEHGTQNLIHIEEDTRDQVE